MKHKKLAIGATAALLATVVAGPAFAEGSWSSFMNKVNVGFESRVWADRDIDQVATTVKLKTCSVSGTTFTSTGITLYQDTIFPFIYTNHGLISNTCGTSSWGQGLGSGNYHFTIEKINGSATTTRTLSAASVVTGY